ncbi:hypothetical protein [Sphingobium amiense]|uniref:hypothetical protein n=1 Tax=Sphingobium amiense TaxID=135719 RepID=UPI0008366927|nr:hypothetical protein [Sphingobium amiense]
MRNAMLFISTVSLAIIAGGTLEASYQDGIVGHAIAAKPATETTYSLVQNVKEGDGWHAYVRDYGMTLEDCTAAMHGMRFTGCEAEG